jgi:hypothetical protein
MENQNNLQQEQTLSQESLLPLEEEQLQDVAGAGGGWEKVLACFTCGAVKQRPAVDSHQEPLLAPLTVDSHQDHSLTRSNSLGHSPSDSPVRRSFTFPNTAVSPPDSPVLTHFIRSASMPAK